MRAQDRRFYLLQEPITATEADSFLGRLVVSKVSPLDKFAPVSHFTKASVKTNDIISTILPTPETFKPFDQSITVAKERGFSVQLSALLNINLSRNEEESRQLQSELVKRYSLAQPETTFLQLMKNDLYAQDVRDLLESTRSGRAYLVTGFITASESTWTVETTNGSTRAFDATVPIGEAVGIPDPGLLHAGVGANGSTSKTHSCTRYVSEEQIIAVSYSVVDMSSKLTWSPNLITSTPVVGRPKRAKGYHLAMSGMDEEEEEEFDWNSDDEECVVQEAKPNKATEDNMFNITAQAEDFTLWHEEHHPYLDIM